MSQSIKLKKVAFTNNLDPNQPTMYKVAMLTPVVVTRDKFIDNVMAHTGMKRSQVIAVLDCMEDCTCDYLELGNAVQLGEDFCTLKPSIKVKASSTLKGCSADTVVSLGVRFIPTGRMRSRMAAIGFNVMGESNGSDVEDSEVVPNNPSGSDDNNQTPDPGNGGASGGGNEMGD